MKKGLIITSIIFFLLIGIVNILAIPNPSPVYCTNMGYTPNATSCIFNDGKYCELWAFYNGNCGKEYVKNLPCSKEGEQVSPGHECCDGLSSITPNTATRIVNGKCDYSVGGWPICSPCGNGVCDKFENSCNCQKDCSTNISSECIKENETGTEGEHCCYGLKEEWVSTNTIGAIAHFVCTKNPIISNNCKDPCPVYSPPLCTNGTLISRGNDKCGCNLGATCCGNGNCEGKENNETCTQDCKNHIVGNDRDEHGCIGSAGYSWCEEKQKCIRQWEENCTNIKDSCGDGICQGYEQKICSQPLIDCKGEDCKPKCNSSCPQDCENKTYYENNTNSSDIVNHTNKILPEVASLRARERLGELGFNITLKEVGNNKEVYEATAEKQGRLFFIIPIKGEVSAEIDSVTGDIIKTHKPWWAFLASGI